MTRDGDLRSSEQNICSNSFENIRSTRRPRSPMSLSQALCWLSFTASSFSCIVFSYIGTIQHEYPTGLQSKTYVRSLHRRSCSSAALCLSSCLKNAIPIPLSPGLPSCWLFCPTSSSSSIVFRYETTSTSVCDLCTPVIAIATRDQCVLKMPTRQPTKKYKYVYNL